MKNPIQQFFAKLDAILAVLVTPGTDTSEIQANIIASFYLELSTRIAILPQAVQLATKMQNQVPTTREDFVIFYKTLTEQSKSMGFDVPNEVIDDASHLVLDSFVKELRIKLPQSKVQQLQSLL